MLPFPQEPLGNEMNIKHAIQIRYSDDYHEPIQCHKLAVCVFILPAQQKNVFERSISTYAAIVSVAINWVALCIVIRSKSTL